jgi:hypothetical protein
VKNVKLVDDWREAHRWWSMRWIIVSAFCSAAVAAYAILPADWLPTVPLIVKQTIGLSAMFSAGFAAVGRVIDQKAGKCSGS